jgi:hypothetical protein
MKLEVTKAPWTPEQVENLNSWQRAGWVHPFTCGSGHRGDKNHLDSEGILVATEQGWVCPYCNYRQDWAHAKMATSKAKSMTPDEVFERLKKASGR